MVKIIVFVLQLFTASILIAQTTPETIQPGDTMSVRTRLVELFEHVRTGNIEKASEYIIYRGKNQSRAWYDVLHYNNPDDRKQAEQVCARIEKFLNAAGPSYRFHIFLFEAPWYVWNLSYEVEGNGLSIAFAFAKIGDKFCLGDIDD